MHRNYFHLSSLLLLIALFAIGCASVKVQYDGELLFDPTATVDVYFSEGDVEKAYTIMGQAVGEGPLRSIDKIQAKLIEDAKLKGADVVVITGIDRSGEGNNVRSLLNALFLKYQ